MKSFSYILSLLILSFSFSPAKEFAQQTVWEDKNYKTSLDLTKIQTRTWDYKSAPSISSDLAVSISRSAFSKVPNSSIDHFSEVSFSNYNTQQEPLWLWKVVFRNGKESLIKTPGGTFKDKDRLIYFIDLDGNIYEPSKLPL
jgi:hypothetical protein